ncbi:ABC transporter ATP-binding protein [Brevundimonas pishanensis]|uniref:ABC transporter ATP-binding protein n=1 Tax=Brevundimonas pishanensis TaxID=2896315 RepID=UPI001FA6F43E|nr:ABC transporter ATP-binding protein [Brevundimonas pishanensis]
MSLLCLEGISVDIARQRLLHFASMTVEAGQMVAVCGPNGAGKSTLLKVAAGLIRPRQGAVQFLGRDLRSLSARQRGESFAYLAQDRTIAWNLPAIEIAALGGLHFSQGDVMVRAARALDLVGVGHLAHRGVADMSGGERARVLLARALVTDAPLLIADEPVAGLDPDASLLVLERLRQRAADRSAVVVTMHDLSAAAQFADRVVVIAKGRVVANAAPLKALTVDVLRDHFKIAGQWVETENGPLLATRRL